MHVPKKKHLVIGTYHNRNVYYSKRTCVGLIRVLAAAKRYNICYGLDLACIVTYKH